MQRKAVVWIETVLYILVGLAIIGTLLAVMSPKIAQTKDSLIISQTVQSLNTLDDTILRVREATGMKLKYTIDLSKGNLVIDSINKKIYWNAISSSQYSEAGRNISVGKIQALTTPSAKQWNITLGLDYSQYNVNFTINGIKETKILSPASLPYTVWIMNNGTKDGWQQIDFTVE